MNEMNSDLGINELISPNFMIFSYYENMEVGEPEIIKALTELKSYVAIHGKIKLVLEVPPTTVMSVEAMNYVQINKYKNENLVALALVIKSIAQRLGAKFYHTRIEVGAPTQFFKTREEAINWISEF
jgi:hypothetical protein